MDIIRRAANIFDNVAVVMFINPEKKYMFEKDDRLEMIKAACQGIKSVRVDESDGMVIDYAAKNGIKTVVRGVRNVIDYEYETKMAAFNKEKGGVETVFFMAEERLCDCSSTEVRRRIEKGETLEGIVPREVLEMANRPF